MNTKTITVYGKELEFDEKFLSIYEKTTTNTLEEIAPCFVEAEFNKEANFNRAERNLIISKKTSDELKEIVLKWAMNDIRHYGVVYP